MLQQYFEAKSRAGGAILLYRMGDFFELFFEDATLAAPLLGLTLTSRNKDSDIEAPMCGMPHHAVEGYIAQLVAAGHRVAVCDQVEDARQGEGPRPSRDHADRQPRDGDGARIPDPRRELSRGRDFRERVGRNRSPRPFDRRISGRDISRRRRRRRSRNVRSARAADSRRRGRRRVFRRHDETAGLRLFSRSAGEKKLRETFRVASVESLGFSPGDPCLGACNAALEYARENRRADTLHVAAPVPLSPGSSSPSRRGHPVGPGSFRGVGSPVEGESPFGPRLLFLADGIPRAARVSRAAAARFGGDRPPAGRDRRARVGFRRARRPPGGPLGSRRSRAQGVANRAPAARGRGRSKGCVSRSRGSGRSAAPSPGSGRSSPPRCFGNSRNGRISRRGSGRPSAKIRPPLFPRGARFAMRPTRSSPSCGRSNGTAEEPSCVSRRAKRSGPASPP